MRSSGNSAISAQCGGKLQNQGFSVAGKNCDAEACDGPQSTAPSGGIRIRKNLAGRDRFLELFHAGGSDFRVGEI